MIRLEFDACWLQVDLHAVTVPHTPAELQKSSYDIAALYLACGIDPKKSKIFIQSHVSFWPVTLHITSSVKLHIQLLPDYSS